MASVPTWGERLEFSHGLVGAVGRTAPASAWPPGRRFDLDPPQPPPDPSGTRPPWWQNRPGRRFGSGYVASAAVVLMTEMVPFGFGSSIGRERSSGGNQDGHHVCFGPRPVRDSGRSGLSTVDPPPRWLDPAARHLRAELPRPEVGRGGQDAEEAWPQARVHDRGRHSAQAPPAPAQRTARHRLTQATPKRSPWRLASRAPRSCRPISLVE